MVVGALTALPGVLCYDMVATRTFYSMYRSSQVSDATLEAFPQPF